LKFSILAPVFYKYGIFVRLGWIRNSNITIVDYTEFVFGILFSVSKRLSLFSVFCQSIWQQMW